MENTKRMTSEILEEMNKSIRLYNEATKNEDYAESVRLNTKCAELKKEYATSSTYETLDSLSTMENPVLAAIKLHDIPTIKTVDTPVQGTNVKIRSVANDKRSIDLATVFRYCNLDTKWIGKAERLNQLFCFRAGIAMGLDKKEIERSYYLTKIAKDIEMGKTPTSNTATLKAIQAVVDEIMFIDNGKGANDIKVTSHDMAFIEMGYTRKSRKLLTIQCGNATAMRYSLIDIMHKIVENKNYALDYKRIKEGK